MANSFYKTIGLVALMLLVTSVHARWVGVDGKKYNSGEQCFDMSPPCYQEKIVKPSSSTEPNSRPKASGSTRSTTAEKYAWCSAYHGNCFGTFPACVKHYGENCKRTLLE